MPTSQLGSQHVHRPAPVPFRTGLLLLFSLLVALPVRASQEWELITVTRGAGWEVNEARGRLTLKENVLEGVLRDRKDGKAEYQVRVELHGDRARATFRFPSEDDAATLTGTYQKAPGPTKTHCPEQIQLTNGSQFVGLARNACQP